LKTQTTNWIVILKLWLPVIIWAILIFSFSSIKTPKVSEFFIGDFIAKKLAHLSEYAVFFALVIRATGGKWAWSYLLTILYSISDEIHQSLVPGRTATVIDLGFDISGANIASYVIWKLKQLRQPKPKK
jgi:hypothetical protein